MEKEKKLGAGIITISVLILIGSAFGILGTIINLAMGDSVNELLMQTGQYDASMLPTTTDYIISLVSSILCVIFVILILLKNKIGVFGYFALSILSRVYSLIVAEITPIVLGGLVLGLAFLALYGFFIRKEIYMDFQRKQQNLLINKIRAI